MKKFTILKIILILLFVICIIYGFVIVRNKLDSGMMAVSLMNLITNPQKYNNRNVQVIGISCIEFEGNAIYFSKDDYENNLDKT